MFTSPLRRDVGRRLACNATKPYGYWATKSNRRAFMDDVAKALGIDATDPQAWKSVQHKDVALRGGRGLLKRYNGSLYEALIDIYPSFKELKLLELRGDMPRNHWMKPSSSRDFLDRAAESLGVETRADWQEVSTKQLQAIPGGHSLLRRYNGSLFAALQDVYGEEWGAAAGSARKIYSFRKRVPRNFWNDEEHVKRFVEDLGKACSVQTKEDWYRVSRRQVEALNGGGLVGKYPFHELLRIAYPGEKWDAERLGSKLGKRSSQRSLASAARLLLGVELSHTHTLNS